MAKMMIRALRAQIAKKSNIFDRYRVLIRLNVIKVLNVVNYNYFNKLLAYILKSMLLLWIVIFIYKKTINPYVYPGIETKIIVILSGIIGYYISFFIFKFGIEEHLILYSNKRKLLIKILLAAALMFFFLVYYKILKVNLFLAQIIIFTISFISLYLNKNIFGEQDLERNKEKIEITIKKTEFTWKFPTLSKVPCIGKVSKWIYQEGILYSISVITLFLTAFIIRIWRLGALSLWWDELITGRIVTRILETGLPLEPSGVVYYTRGLAYHYITSIFVFIFGHNEFWIRFPSVIFGMCILVISFWIARKIDRKIALLILLFLTFSTYNIEYSRFARFYIMNAFLFMLSITTVYKGFFEDQLRYKVASGLIFIVMLLTVQLGELFLVVFGVFFLYQFIQFISMKYKKMMIKKKSVDITFGVFFLGLFCVNRLIRYILIPKFAWETVQEGIPQPTAYPLIKIPVWSLFKFMNNYYAPIIFVLILGLFIVYNTKREEKPSFFKYLVLVFFASILIFEIFNRDVIGPRIFLFGQALFVILSIFSIYYILKTLFNKRYTNIVYTVLTLVVVVLLLGIRPYFYERINIAYGESVADDPFVSTDVAKYRADYKTTYEYLRGNLKDGDIWINVMQSSYFTLNRGPDYILNQNYRWKTYSIYEEGIFVDPAFGSILISKADEIEKIIEDNRDKRVFIVINGGSTNIRSTVHTRKDFRDFIKKNKDKEVYNSKDGYSKVLLFKQINQSTN